jgi:hypothetical protein
MTLPAFDAELALESHALRRTFPGPTTTGDPQAVIPQQSLFPPGTPLYTCSPPCTWGPPLLQLCCAVICVPVWSGEICYQSCYRRIAPQCPR